MSYQLQGPGETITWSFDFTDLIGAGDSIASQAVTATEGATVANIAEQDGVVSVDVSGVPFGRVCRVLCTATLNNGQVLQKTAALRGGAL